MTLLVDGYNVMFAIGRLRHGAPTDELAAQRRRFLNDLASRLSAADRSQATVVFDARFGPSHLAPIQQHDGLTVQFATQHSEADDLIEELLKRASVPRRITVVSSDHRLQEAARRRRASFVDSADWWFSLPTVDQHPRLGASSRSPASDPASAAPSPSSSPLSSPPLTSRPRPEGEADPNYWLQQFSGAGELPDPRPAAGRHRPGGQAGKARRPKRK